MAIQIRCDRCGMHYAAPVTAGASYPCPRCGQRQQLPGGGDQRRGGLRRPGRMGRPGFRARAPVQDEGYEDMEDSPRPVRPRPRIGLGRPRPGGFGGSRPLGAGRPRPAFGARPLAGPGLRRAPRPMGGDYDDEGGEGEEGYEGEERPSRFATPAKKDNSKVILIGGIAAAAVVVVVLVLVFSGGGLGEYEAITKETIAFANEASSVLEGIRDADSVKRELPRLQALVPRAKALERRVKALSPPSESVEKALEKKYGDAIEKAQGRFATALLSLVMLAAQDPRLREVLQQLRPSM